MRISDVARPVTLLLGAVMLLSACAGATQSSGEAAVAPTMVIERFLRAANQNDLDTMSKLFGTTSGPVSATWPKKEQDERMFLLASLLRHTDYTIGAEQIVPGRRHEATQYLVSMDIAQRRVQVPFVLVRSRSDWLIENIDIQPITRSAGSR